MLRVLGVERGRLRSAQVAHGACGVHAVVAWQPLVKGLKQRTCGHAVIFGQGHGNVCP